MPRRWIIVGVLFFLVLISFGSLVGFYTDLLWFQEIDFDAVFLTILWTRVGVGAVAGALAALFVAANLEIARRTAPRYRFATAGGDLAEQYRSLFRPYAMWLNLGVAALVGFLTGTSTSTAWERYLLWRNAVPWGVQDAQFGIDLSFFVFSIPFQRAILSLGFGILVATLLLALLGHLLNGSIEPRPDSVRVAPVVKVHASILLGLIALLKAWAYRLDQFELVYSPRGVVTGASYTDVHAQLPALRLLMIIAVVAAVIFFVNLRFRGWLLPGAAIALWAFSSLLLGALIPAAVQRFQVTPNESEREEPYIERNIEATRQAFGLDEIDVRPFAAREDVDQPTIDANQATIENIRVWNPASLIPTYQQLESLRPYYEFTDVDVDRYTVDGRMRQVMLSAREINPLGLEAGAQNWVNTRLQYTHGYGFVATPSSSVTPEGLPTLLVQDLPPEGPEALVPDEGGIYYGENVPDYAVVQTEQSEIDYPISEGEGGVRRTTYQGRGGVELTGLLRRGAFAWRFGDTDLLISNFITPESRFLMRRNILERAQTVAPFLVFDRDPYLVAGDDRMFWILDAYTVTDRYPYSQRLNLGNPFPQTHRGDVNYMRNSVKVVVDAYHGTMEFFVIDEGPPDPLIRTYQAAFPDLFTPGSEMPEEVREHLRYPEDLFMVQAWQYQLYHMTDPQDLYSEQDAWSIPLDPVLSTSANRIPMEPYYVVMKLPEEQEEEFLLMLPFTPKDRPNLNGWVAARSDPGKYGELIGFSFPRGESIEGPVNVQARIEQNGPISQQFSLWTGAGSRVQRGDLLVIPIGQSLIYIQPIYLQTEQAERALPELRRVIVVIGDRIGFAPTLTESIAQALEGTGPVVVDPEEEEEIEPGEQPEATPAPPPTGDVADLLRQAAEHFDAAEAALRDGDLAAYQRETRAARDAVQEARRQAEGG